MADPPIAPTSSRTPAGDFRRGPSIGLQDDSSEGRKKSGVAGARKSGLKTGNSRLDRLFG